MLSGIKNLFSIDYFNAQKETHQRDIILTGVPRSGSTLACKLLCDIPDVIGLNEPLAATFFPNREKAIQAVHNNFVRFRKSLLKKGVAPVRSKDGSVTDNAYSQTKEGDRKRVLKRTNVYFDKTLSPDFTLVMKHCAEFSLLFPELTRKYNCFATIRNPLALLGSWNSVNVPVSRGKVAKSKKVLPSFHKQIEAIDELYDKQLFILSWYFQQYDSLSVDHIIRYEELVASNGRLLSKIVDKEVVLPISLKNRNHSQQYDKEVIAQLAEKLLESEGAYWKYYSKSDVEQLLNQYFSE